MAFNNFSITPASDNKSVVVADSSTWGGANPAKIDVISATVTFNDPVTDTDYVVDVFPEIFTGASTATITADEIGGTLNEEIPDAAYLVTYTFSTATDTYTTFYITPTAAQSVVFGSGLMPFFLFYGNAQCCIDTKTEKLDAPEDCGCNDDFNDDCLNIVTALEAYLRSAQLAVACNRRKKAQNLISYINTMCGCTTINNKNC